jgi:Amt family ammonium transporter
MIRKLMTELRRPEVRRKFGLAFGAKMLGLMVIFAIMALVSGVFGSPAHAQGATPETPAYVNPINTAWTLIAAFLVFFMQAGFMALEAGFARERESVNIILEGIVDTCLCGILFWLWGFAWMFGSGNGFIGNQYYMLAGAPATYGTTGIATIAFWLFQFACADTCSTITSGAMLGRTGFIGDLIYSFGVSGFIYPILGHWCWGPDGFLATMGSAGHFLPSVGVAFHDFAGSTVVHTIGGIVALTGAIALGPRLGRVFKRDGGGLPPGHNLPLAAIGGVILWFGWYGFNPGSTLSAMDIQGIGRVATNTTLAACAGGLAAMLYVFPRGKVWDTGITVNGFLAGLVGITCPCYWVSPAGAIAIGAVAGVIVVMAIDFVEWLRVDDPVGAVAVHGACGIWGTISLGLFATGAFGASGPLGPDNSAPVKGLFYGGGASQLIAQIIGSAIITGASFAIGMALMYATKATGQLRVSEKGEKEGLDYHEHGAVAYPEFSIRHLAVSATPEPSVLKGLEKKEAEKVGAK